LYSPTCTSQGGEFIVDVHTRHVDLSGSWPTTNPDYAAFFLGCSGSSCPREAKYVTDLFRNSDTTVTVLSGFPAISCSASRTTGCGLPLSNAQIASTRDHVNTAAESERILATATVLPNAPSGPDLPELDAACAAGVAALELFPSWEVTAGTAFHLDDAVVEPFFQKAAALGLTRIAVTRGTSLPQLNATYDVPTDIGPAAKKYPGMRFIVRNAAVCSSDGPCDGAQPPYDPVGATSGTNTLIRSLLDAGVEPNSNVYVDLGLALRMVQVDPNATQHLVGKLLKYVGEDNVLWATTSIWPPDSPQALIEFFRSLQIPQQLQDQYGYPALTTAVKAKIFGLNAARLFELEPTAVRCAVP
jgi:predicted TIM-barrel fold metal-dependent hydrolase